MVQAEQFPETLGRCSVYEEALSSPARGKGSGCFSEAPKAAESPTVLKRAAIGGVRSSSDTESSLAPDLLSSLGGRRGRIPATEVLVLSRCARAPKFLPFLSSPCYPSRIGEPTSPETTNA